MINREKAEALIQEQVHNAIVQDVPKQSSVLSLMRRLPNMTSKQTRMPVLDMLPMAYWVNGDTGYKQTSRQAWENVYLTAAELAVIVPIPEAVLEDASYDIFGEITPRAVEAMYKKVDEAILFGIGKPNEWEADILTRARQAGNSVSGGITFDTLMGEDGLLAKVEQAGYMTSGFVADMGARAKLRGIKDDNGQPLFARDMQSSTPYTLDGAPIAFPQNGGFDSSLATIVAGAWDQAVFAIRQDVTVKILTEAVIQDPSTREIVYNLAQQDMVALRIVMRLGWALPNPATRMNEDRLNVPFAYLQASSEVPTQKVTFTVTDDAEAPVAGAIVTLSGARKKTTSLGVAEFTMQKGSYSGKIKADGFVPQNVAVTVDSSAVDVSVELVGE